MHTIQEYRIFSHEKSLSNTLSNIFCSLIRINYSISCILKFYNNMGLAVQRMDCQLVPRTV